MPIPDENNLPDPISTPEGDNETLPDAPLGPPSEAPQTPPGSAPNPHDSDKAKPTGIEKFIDEVASGEYM
jgi:hypothetical protein